LRHDLFRVIADHQGLHAAVAAAVPCSARTRESRSNTSTGGPNRASAECSAPSPARPSSSSSRLIPNTGWDPCLTIGSLARDLSASAAAHPPGPYRPLSAETRESLNHRHQRLNGRARSPSPPRHVVVGDARRDPLHVGGTTTITIADAGGVARFVEADVRSGDDIDRLVEAALDLGGGRLTIVNNAMVAAPIRRPVETSEDDWDIILDVRPRGSSWLPARRAPDAHPGAARRVRGRVINISSQHGMVGAPGNVAYSRKAASPT
jgi:hypothetical protein